MRRGNLPGGTLDGIVCLDDGALVRVELGRVELVIWFDRTEHRAETTIALPNVKSPTDIGFVTRRGASP